MANLLLHIIAERSFDVAGDQHARPETRQHFRCRSRPPLVGEPCYRGSRVHSLALRSAAHRWLPTPRRRSERTDPHSTAVVHHVRRRGSCCYTKQIAPPPPAKDRRRITVGSHRTLFPASVKAARRTHLSYRP